MKDIREQNKNNAGSSEGKEVASKVIFSMNGLNKPISITLENSGTAYDEFRQKEMEYMCPEDFLYTQLKEFYGKDGFKEIMPSYNSKKVNKSIDEKLYSTAHFYYGDDMDKRSAFIWGAVFYRKFALEEINKVLPEIKGESES